MPNFRPWTLACIGLEISLRCKKQQFELTEFKWHFEECLQEISLTDFWLNVHKEFTSLANKDIRYLLVLLLRTARSRVFGIVLSDKEKGKQILNLKVT